MNRPEALEREYRRVKDRVEREDRALGRIVLETGIGMLLSLLAAIFLLR